MRGPYITFRLYYAYVTDIETLKEIARSSEEVFVGGSIKYIYDFDMETFYLAGGQGEFSLGIVDFFNFCKTKDLYIKTKRKLPLECIHKTKVNNWSKAITDLEKLGIVTTFATKSHLAVDPRKFYIVGEDESEARDVDFLGTDFAKEISDEILDLWVRHIKGFKVLSKSI